MFAQEKKYVKSLPKISWPLRTGSYTFQNVTEEKNHQKANILRNVPKYFIHLYIRPHPMKGFTQSEESVIFNSKNKH